MFQRTLQGAADTLVRLIHSNYCLDCQAHISSCTCYLLHFHHHLLFRTPCAHASVVAETEIRAGWQLGLQQQAELVSPTDPLHLMEGVDLYPSLRQ
jgi:hypothetical protein